MWCQTEDVPAEPGYTTSPNVSCKIGIKDPKLCTLQFINDIEEMKRKMSYVKRVRCLKCGKNFKPYVKICGDGCCYWLMLPKHKVKESKPRQKTRHEKNIR